MVAFVQPKAVELAVQVVGFGTGQSGVHLTEGVNRPGVNVGDVGTVVIAEADQGRRATVSAWLA